jgi:hypothetical protein
MHLQPIIHVLIMDELRLDTPADTVCSVCRNNIHVEPAGQLIGLELPIVVSVHLRCLAQIAQGVYSVQIN